MKIQMLITFEQGSHRPAKVLEFDLDPGKLLEFEKKVPFVLELSWNFVKLCLEK